MLTEQTLSAAVDRADDPDLLRAFHGARQVVERAIGRLEGLFHLHFPRARTLAGIWARLSAKSAAHNALLYLNHLLGRPLESHYSPCA